MAYLEFEEFPDLIKYYATIVNGTLLRKKYNTIKECTLLKDIEHFMYLTQPYFSDNTPYQILHIMSTLLLCSKISTLLFVKNPTLYDILTITQENLIQWDYHLDNPNMSMKPKFPTYLLPPLAYSGEVSHHMCDSGESNDMSVCHTIKMTSQSVCLSHHSSVSHTVIMTSLSV